MKFRRQPLTEGVTFDGNKFDIRLLQSSTDDIIDVAYLTIHQSKLDNNIYYFGYKFKDDVPTSVRSKFLHWIKGLDVTVPEEFFLENFIALPVIELNKRINLNEFSCVLYPRSNRSDLTHTIHRCVLDHLTAQTITSFEFIKTLPSEVTFNWEKFDALYSGELGDNQYQQIKQHVENILLPKIHSQEYFSLAQNVKSKYRPYIQNFLKFESPKHQAAFQAINSGKILIIDDINTSGSTLREIVRIIRSLSPDVDIYIFTLIGK